MLIEKSDYRRNRNGEIVKRQVVSLRCDECDTVYSKLWEYRKRQVYDKDYCRSCSCKITYAITGKNLAEARWRPITAKYSLCTNCGNEFRHKSQKSNQLFCGKQCERNYIFVQKFGHLESVFESHPDEIAYLFGLILGDGHLKKTAKNSTRISIAFDIEHTTLIDTAKDVLQSLRISFFVEPKVRKNCQMIGFVLPDSLLEKYSMLWSGDKFAAQPKPVDKIISNINFASGLINSDGSYVEDSRGYEKIQFVNTVNSIANSFSTCLDRNGIDHRRYHYDPKIDNRTGKINKSYHSIQILKQLFIDKVKLSSRFCIKEKTNGQSNSIVS